MKNWLLFFVFISTLCFSQKKEVYSSKIQWWGYRIAKTEATSNSGVVNLKSGNLVMKGNQVVGGTFVMDMNSINATNLSGDRQMQLNDHLKSGDFFEVEKYPTASFKIISTKKNNHTNFNTLITGILTIKNKTEKISFPANISIKNGIVTLVSDKFSFDRQKFDVAFRSTAKDVVIKDDVDMLISLSAK